MPSGAHTARHSPPAHPDRHRSAARSVDGALRGGGPAAERTSHRTALQLEVDGTYFTLRISEKIVSGLAKD